MNKFNIFFYFIFIIIIKNIQAQTGNVGIGTATPDASAILDISSTS